MQEGWVGTLVLLGVLLITLVIAFLTRGAELRRKREYVAVARQLGLEYWEKSPPGCLSFVPLGGVLREAGNPVGILQELHGMGPIGISLDQHIDVMAFGTLDEIDWFLAEMTYCTGSGKNRSDYRRSFVAARARMNLPRLTLRPQGMMDKLGTLVGIKDMQFESHEFNQRYFVMAEDPRVASAIVHPEMMEYLLSIPPTRLEIAAWWIVASNDRLETPEGQALIMRRGKQFVNLVPEFVRTDYAIQPMWLPLSGEVESLARFPVEDEVR